MKRDYHMHTFLSDGEPSPADLVRACIALNLDEISITDHDSIGSYPEVFEIAKGSKLRIVPGGEFDCAHGDAELHMLGVGVDITNQTLNNHLATVQSARKRRATQQAEAINRFYGRKVIDLTEIFARCQTFMNPHLIHAMMDQGLFDEYELPDRYKVAARWMKQNIKVDTVLEKTSAEAMIRMIHGAGGIAALAHPAYYQKDGHDLHRLVADLRDMGMDGLEVYYPYFQEGSREFPTASHEREAIALLHDLAGRYGLQETVGSDSHELKQLTAFHTRG